MFGYVRPLRGELKVREAEAYQGVYCGLCHALGRSYGLLARMFLSYDLAFLAMILSAGAEPLDLQSRRCIACPIRGKQVCAPRHSLEVAADESVILVYWKLRDSAADESFWKSLGARLLSLLLRRAYRKAAARQPRFAEETVQCLEELRRLEEEACPSLDRTADTFARMLRAAAPATGDPGRDRSVGELLYHVGRWVYLVDAWDDLKEDRACGRYNPVERRWDSEPERHQEEMRTTAAALVLDGEAARWAHIGDSRIYRISGGAVTQLTRDHSVTYMKYLGGEISYMDVPHDDDRSSLLRVLGKLPCAPEGGEGEVLPGDAFLLCSDGFWEFVYNEEMLIDRLKSRTPEEWVKAMLLRHIRRTPPGSDNFSLIAVFAEEEA